MKEYRLTIEKVDSRWIVTVYKVNIEPAGYQVAQFSFHKRNESIERAMLWLQGDKQ